MGAAAQRKFLPLAFSAAIVVESHRSVAVSVCAPSFLLFHALSAGCAFVGREKKGPGKGRRPCAARCRIAICERILGRSQPSHPSAAPPTAAGPPALGFLFRCRRRALGKSNRFSKRLVVVTRLGCRGPSSRGLGAAVSDNHDFIRIDLPLFARAAFRGKGSRGRDGCRFVVFSAPLHCCRIRAPLRLLAPMRPMQCRRLCWLGCRFASSLALLPLARERPEIQHSLDRTPAPVFS